MSTLITFIYKINKLMTIKEIRLEDYKSDRL